MQDFQRSAQRKSGDMELSIYPAYHLWLSVRDMARIGLLMLHEGNWAGEQLIPQEWVKESISIITSPEEMNPDIGVMASLHTAICGGFGQIHRMWLIN